MDTLIISNATGGGGAEGGGAGAGTEASGQSGLLAHTFFALLSLLCLFSFARFILVPLFAPSSSSSTTAAKKRRTSSSSTPRRSITETTVSPLLFNSRYSPKKDSPSKKRLSSRAQRQTPHPQTTHGRQSPPRMNSNQLVPISHGGVAHGSSRQRRKQAGETQAAGRSGRGPPFKGPNFHQKRSSFEFPEMRGMPDVLGNLSAPSRTSTPVPLPTPAADDVTQRLQELRRMTSSPTKEMQESLLSSFNKQVCM